MKTKLSWQKINLFVVSFLIMGFVAVNQMGLGIVEARTGPAGPDWVGTLDSPAGVKIGGTELDPSNANETVGNVLTWLLDIAFAVAVILVLGNIIFGAYQWITSGGKSDKIAAGRNRIIWAIVGLILVAAAWGLTVVIQGFFVDNGGTLQIDVM